jgi:hypothetical protein
MKSPLQICAELRDRDLYDLCDEVARQNGVKLADVCSSSHAGEIVQARHAVWHKLSIWFGGNASAVARLFGANVSTVRQALLDQPPPIIHVLLNASPDHGLELAWFAGRVNPFRVRDERHDVSTWFPTYEQARTVYTECCEQAGEPTFRSASSSPAPAMHAEGGR